MLPRETAQGRQAGIVEGTLSVHLQIRNKSIPVTDATPTRPGMHVHACKAKCGRDQDSRTFAVRAKCFPIDAEACVEASWTPTAKDGSQGGLIYLEQICQRLQVWSERDNRTNIQIPVGPTIQATTDTWRQRIIDGRMAKAALYADGTQTTVGLEETGYTDDGVELEQRESGRRIIEIYFPSFLVLG